MDFTQFLQSVSGMESSYGATSTNTYGMTGAAGTNDPLALAQSNFNSLSTRLGQAPNDFQQYMAWNQGVGGAMSLFSADPNAAASSVVPLKNLTGNIGKSSGLDAATMSVSDFLGNMSSRWAANGGGGIGVSGMSKAATATIGGGVLAGSTSESWLTTIEHWFVRGAIIALGFVFVFGGLVMMSAGVIEGSMRRRALRESGSASKATTKVRRAQVAAIGKPAPAPQITIQMPAKAPAAPRAPRRTKAQMIGAARAKVAHHDSVSDLEARTINARAKPFDPVKEADDAARRNARMAKTAKKDIFNATGESMARRGKGKKTVL
jgi:hypothetical protein